MRILKNAFWLGAGRITGDLSSFALFVAISRSFGPATTGEYSYAFALASILAFIACAGFDEYGTALYARSTGPAERQRLWSDILSAQGLQLAASVLCFALFLAASGSGHARKSVIVQLSTLLTGLYLARTFFIPAYASQAMRTPSLIDLGCRISAIALALVCILTTRASLPVLLAGFPVAGVLEVVLAARNAAAHGAALRPHFDLRRIARTLRASSPFTACELLGQFYARTDFLLIAFLLGNADVGLYATGMKFVEYGIIPLYLLGLAAYPSLSRAAVLDPVAFLESVRELARVMLFLGGWLAVGLAFLVPLLIEPIFGARFAPAVHILPWFAALALLKGGEAALYRVMYAVRRPTVYFVAILAGTAVTIVLNVVLIPLLGLVGAAVAALASVAVVVSVCAVYLHRFVTPRTLLGAVARLAVALAATAAVVAGAQHVEAPSWVVALAGCASYPVFGFLVGLLPHPTRSRLLHPKTPETLADGAA